MCACVVVAVGEESGMSRCAKLLSAVKVCVCVCMYVCRCMCVCVVVAVEE